MAPTSYETDFPSRMITILGAPPKQPAALTRSADVRLKTK